MPLSRSLKRISKRSYTICRGTGKRRYKTYSEAYAEYERQLAKPLGKPPTNFYKCDLCGGYHMTTQEERRTDG